MESLIRSHRQVGENLPRKRCQKAESSPFLGLGMERRFPDQAVLGKLRSPSSQIRKLNSTLNASMARLFTGSRSIYRIRWRRPRPNWKLRETGRWIIINLAFSGIPTDG